MTQSQPRYFSPRCSSSRSASSGHGSSRYCLWRRGAARYSLALPVLLLCLFGQSVHANEDIAWRSAVLASTTLFMITNPLHADRMSIEAGHAKGVDVARIGFQWGLHDDVMELFGYTLDVYVQADYSKWQANDDASQRGSNNTLGATPVFRFSREYASFTPYIETGIGFYVFSRSTVNDNELGSNFQFGDMLGIGAQFGERRQWGMSYKFQHHSNNSLALPNNGINLHFVTLTYQY